MVKLINPADGDTKNIHRKTSQNAGVNSAAK
jgi:hypothetical protein